MKFRCVITDSSYIQRFTHAIQILSKFSKQCVCRISSSGLFFISFEETGERQPVVWLKIDQQKYFGEYNLSGVSEKNNEICLKIVPQVLLKVLNSYKLPQLISKNLKISLTKRKTPCLTLEILRSDPGPTRLCLHDIPVDVMPRKEWDDIRPPEIVQSPDLNITLPDLDNFESIWDKLKNLSRHIVVLANGRGALSLRIETELSDVTSHFKDLPVIVSPEYENLDDFVKGRVKCNKFMILRDLYQGNPSKVLLHISNRKYLLFDIFFGDLTVHYIVAAVRK